MDRSNTAALIVPPQQFSKPMVGVGYVGDIHCTNGSVSNNVSHNISPYQPSSTNEYHQFNVVPNTINHHL